MSIFKTTKSGKCDVTITLFDEHNELVMQRSSTFDFKPTIKEFKEKYKYAKKEFGAKIMIITTTPSCEVRHYKI